MASARAVLTGLFAFCSLLSVAGQVIFPINHGSENGHCETSAGTPGYCTRTTGCSTPLISSSGSFLKICSFSPFLICCPGSENMTGSIVDAKQVSAPLTTFTCGKRGSIPIGFGSFARGMSFPSGDFPVLSLKRRRRASDLGSSLRLKPFGGNEEVAIVGGKRSYANSWPWMVLLGKKRGPSNLFFCGGALINNRYMLTAAHCVLDPGSFFVRLGEHGISGAEETKGHEDIEMEDVIFHPEYKFELGYHDMALVKLARPVSFRNEIKPVCLPWGPTGAEDIVNKTVTLTGWGAQEFGGPLASILREVKVTVFDPSRCQKSYATLPDFVKSFPKGMSKDNIVCAGDRLGGKDSCQGDSGGPMVHEGQRGVFNLAGIISKGYGCGKAGFPGLYAPLRHYGTLNWIKKTAF